jgi:4-amino-4-deoxy-L-arabinose transferase-like glycosyltransferase
LLAVVAAAFVGLGLRQAWTDSPTFDETIYLSAGVTSLDLHDLRLNPEHPPLAKALAAVPVLFDHPVIPRGPGWQHNHESLYATDFVHAQLAAGKLRTEMFLVRLVPLLEAVAVAFALFALCSRLFSRACGLLAGVAWLANPFVLGIGHLDGVDLPLTLCAVLVAWALLNVLREPGRRQLVVAGLACAAAVLSKDDGLLVAASAGLVVTAAGWPSVGWRVLGRLALMGGVAWVAVWGCYLAIDPGSSLHLTVLPEPFLTGLRYLGHHDTIGSAAYLVGRSWVGGTWWYWPVSLVVKVPLLTVALLVVGPFGLRLATRTARREVLAVAVLPAVILTAFTVIGPRDIGFRYLLPVLALWLAVASAAALATARTVVRAALVVVVAAGAAAVALSASTSLSWVNPPFSPAYRSVSNSDVDWGQSFWLLQSWSKGKHPWVAYFGQGLEVSDLPGARPMLTQVPGASPSVVVSARELTGWVAVSATSLTSTNARGLAFLRAQCPVAELGGSILVYRFVRPPSGRPGPARPAALCPGPVSHRVDG